MEQILNSIANPVNHVAQAYTARTNQLEADQKAETQQRDNDMLKVFEYAGDGRTDEAKYYAQQKKLEVPQEIFSNADFAKGLALSGKFYGDDPEGAQKFTLAWVSNPNGDFLSRFNAATQTAGAPKLKASTLDNKIQFEMWKLQNIPEKPPISRYEAGQKAYNASLQGGMALPADMEAARQKAMLDWDAEFGSPATPSTGLVGGGAGATPTPSGTQNWNAGVMTLPDVPNAPSPVTNTQGGSAANAYSEAMIAIARGADPQAVYGRLQERGIDPTPIMNQ